ncbi:hypothetical protein [Quadrisphaera sp. INWT6]|uniref:hypothetical protein n=1 Tax=Quadrisphaera sp. INWT6 TaxID=2596917 RepID=UPI0018927B34|nr:hypothetical protein [Quadrisphaera sp. INWT6]MBF5082659.1 hypothetical protein [Quadrisphaera sp. INWT6]
MVTPATLSRRPVARPRDPGRPWLLRVELAEGGVLVVEWTTTQETTPRADQVDDALDGSGWVLAGPLLEVSPGTWSIDLVPE